MSDTPLFQFSDTKPVRLTKGSIRLLVTLQLLLVFLVLVGVHITTYQLRQITLDNLQNHASLQTENLSDRLTQNLNLLHLHFDALVTDHPDVATNQDALRDVLRQLQAKLHYIRSISVMDEHNNVFVSTRPDNEGIRVELGDLQPEIHATGLLQFGAAWHGRDFADGSPFTAHTRLDRPDAGFFPITLTLPDAPHWSILVAINSDYFINAAPLHRAPGDLAYRLILDNGNLLMSTAEEEQPGSRLLDNQQLEYILHNHSGTQRWHDTEGQLQLGAYRASHSHPWFIHAQASADYALQQWRKDTQRLWLLSCTVLGIILLIGSLFTRRVHRTLQKEQQMLEQTSLAAMVFMHSTDLISITDRNRKLIAVNPAYEKTTGFTAAEILGKIPGTFHSCPESELAYADLWQTLKTQDQ